MSKNGLPYYKAYPRDFIEGTIGMPFEVKCTYRVILDLIYMQGGELPDDARYISGMLGCSIRKWKSIRSALLQADKIQVSGEFLSNYRAGKELESLAKLQDKQREKGSISNKNKDLQKPRLSQPEPEPDIEERTTKVVPKNRGTRLPDNWVPDIGFAIDQGLSKEEAETEADKFRDWWPAQPGQKGVKVDWGRTWKTWARSAGERKRKIRSGNGRENHQDKNRRILQEMTNGQQGTTNLQSDVTGIGYLQAPTRMED